MWGFGVIESGRLVAHYFHIFRAHRLGGSNWRVAQPLAAPASGLRLSAQGTGIMGDASNGEGDGQIVLPRVGGHNMIHNVGPRL